MGKSGTTVVHEQSAAGDRNTRRRAGHGRSVQPEAVLLLRMAQTGDRDAFAELYRAFVGHVRRYVAARMREGDRDAVADLVQDTFTAALGELDRAHDDVEVWFIRLAARMCTRHSWGQRRYLRAALTVGEHERRRDALVPTDGARHTRLIAQALAELDPRERMTVQLRFLDGYPRRTTAQIMACSEWAVRQAQYRALRQLADRLGGAVRHDPAAQPSAD
ncbi:MAG TPA: sigma-70 family RNA polymerase sigma factor [Rugosimonospora sp.]|jgi:RNA polymerase sigma-70 factor (ECF subfamily)